MWGQSAPLAGLFCESRLAMTTTPPTLIRDPWRRLWHFFTGDVFLATAVILMAALLSAAAMLPQTPTFDPIAYSRWLSDARTRFGSPFDLLSSLGLFTVTSSLLFRFALALLGLSAALRLIDLRDRLRHAALADRAVTRRSGFALILSYGGLLTILLGLLIGNFGDTRADDLVILPGKLSTVPGTAYTLRLDAVDHDRATIALLQQTETRAQGTIASKQPLQSDLAVYLAQVGPALSVSATRGPTETLNLQITASSPAQPQVLLAFTPNQSDAFVAAPQTDLVLRISPSGGGEYVAQIYQSATGKDLGSQPFKSGESITVDGTTFTFQPAAYVVVAVANQPSHWIIALGAILTTLGLAGVWLWPIGSATTRSERTAQVLMCAAWLIATLLVWAQLIAVYPVLASFNGLAQPIESSLAAWLLISGSLLTRRRVRWSLLLLGIAVIAATAVVLMITLD
jgi:hypothetical protein